MDEFLSSYAGASAGVSRRSFMQHTAAFGAISAGGLSLLSKRAAAAPKSGGTLRMGLGGGSTTDSLDPRTYADSVPIVAGYTLMNGLIEIDDNNRPIPELFESWSAEDRARKWVFKVRQGVTFHNGKTLDADDIVYSINLHRGASKSGLVGQMKAVSDVKASDKNEVTITLSESDADLPYILGDFHLLVVPKDFDDWSKPIGTGAYQLESWEPGVRLIAKKAGSYWKPDHGMLDGIDLTVINDTAQRMNALISGQVDIIHRVDKKSVDLLKSAPDIEMVEGRNGWHAIMAMQVDVPPYDNNNLRLALKYALDREQILKTLFNGFGHVGNDHPIPPADPYYNSELPQYVYDGDKAKFYFNKAGIAAPKIALSASDAAFGGAVDMAVLFQASAAKAGIPINVKKEPADGFYDNVWLKAPFVTSYWNGRPSATQLLTAPYRKSAPWNETHWANDRYEKLLSDAKAETDETKRKAYIWEMQAMLHNDGGALIPIFSGTLDAHNSRVKGQAPTGWLELDNCRISERAWMEG
jgi:peptide/nickel transport system substrate-binding protein